MGEKSGVRGGQNPRIDPGLTNEHVKARTPESAFAKSISNRFFVNHWASGCVDQNRRWLHDAKCLRIDEVSSLLGERYVKTDDVCDGQNLRK